MSGTKPSLFPFLESARGYRLPTLRADLVAGITVAVFAVPQTMAYAILAGVPPVYGLYAAIVMSVVAALWGSSAYVNTGPSNSAALLTAAAVLPFAARGDHLEIVFAFTLLVGIIRLLMGLFRFGSLVDFVPEPAFLGFTIGAGTLIALGQLHLLFNIPRPDQSWFVLRTLEVLGSLPQANPFAIAIGLGTAALMLAGGRFARRFPIPLIAIVLATVAASVAPPSSSPIRLVQDIALVPTGLPTFHLPLFDPLILWTLLPGACAVAVIGLIEAVSIGQSLALKHNQTLNYNQEFVGQGLSHLVSAFFQGMPGSGSFGRSALIEQCGGRTRFANVFFGFATAISVLLIPGLLGLIPISALAGLLLYVGVKLVDVPRIKRVWATSTSDASVLVLTFVVTVFVKVEYGIFAGIVAAALLYLRRSRDLRLYEILPNDQGRFTEHRYAEMSGHAPSDIVAISLGGDLFYAMAASLRNQLQEIVHHQRPRFIILRIRTAYSMDSSCWNALFDVAEAFWEQGGKIYLCGVRPDFKKVIEKSHMKEFLPPEHIFPVEEEVYRAFAASLGAIGAQLGPDRELSEDWAAYYGGGNVANEAD